MLGLSLFVVVFPVSVLLLMCPFNLWYRGFRMVFVVTAIAQTIFNNKYGYSKFKV
jgi:hypothetical protein